MLSSRRTLLTALPALALLPGCAGTQTVAPVPDRMERPAAWQAAVAELQVLETRSSGRLGAYVLDSSSGAGFGWRADERFGMCSTFKMALAGVILMEIQAGRLAFDQHVPLTEADMFPTVAPIAQASLALGYMTVGQMAEGTQKTSDNICANMLLRLIEGPEGFTRRLRALGDEVTRVDRYEPEMNNVPPGEVRDTTSPLAHAHLMRTLLLGQALNETHKALLIQWMIDTQTGLRRIRAGLPEGWRAGDKTGTGYSESIGNKTNDIAIVWPPGQAPLLITAYLETPFFDGIRDEDQALLAELGRIAAKAVTAG
jgi:beta-lactamase class A